jgi:ribosomal protein L32
MAKRMAVNTKNKTSRSKKTKKRLAVKKAMLDAKKKKFRS